MATTAFSASQDQTVSIRIALPANILASYEQKAEELRISLEEAISLRLARCRSHSDTKPLYFNDEDRQSLESILGKNFSSPMDVLRTLRASFSIKLNKITIPLRPALLARLTSRCFTGDFEKWLAERVTETLEQYCGMR